MRREERPSRSEVEAEKRSREREICRWIVLFSYVARLSIHATVVQTHDVEGIVTADKVFDRIRGLKRFELK